MKIRLLAIIILAIGLLSCERLYQGNIIEKRVIPGYYYIYERHENDYKYKRKSNTSEYVYVGSYFTENYAYPSYAVIIKGRNKQEKEITNTIYVDREKFDAMKEGDFIQLGQKQGKKNRWFYSFSPINKVIPTGKFVFLGISDSREDEFDVKRRFNYYILPMWIASRDHKIEEDW